MIHPQAIVDKEAHLEADVEIGPYAIVERGVRLRRGVKVLALAQIKGDTEIGEDTLVGEGALLGAPPQILGHKENKGKLRIGKNNIIREYVTVHTSSSTEAATLIGDDNYLMAFSHIAHDCQLGSGIVICNGTLIAGHVRVEDSAFLSGNVVVHQFVHIGRLAMIGGLSRINQDVPPFMLAVGDSRIWGVNLVGLKRKGFSLEQINQIKKAFNILYRKSLSLPTALEELRKLASPYVQEILNFILLSKRGICGPHQSSFGERLFLDYPYWVRTTIPTYSVFLKTRKRLKGRFNLF